jgi:hypothetical protein
MSYDSTLFNVDPYFDDFKESKKFLRVMFKPGYALQAREVTQLQTILQNQIDRFGQHIFENGSVVLNGQVTENYLRYARITGLTGFTDVTSLIGSVVESATTNQAKVIHAESGLSSSTIDSYPVIYFEYLQGGTAFSANNVLSGTAGSVSVSFSLSGNTTVPAVGEATVVAVNSGVRFVDGYFVLHDAQMIAASTLTGSVGAKYRDFANPTTRVGFKANKSFVTAAEDESLNDPAFGYYNYSAPGADRFKIDLGLTQCEFNPTDTNATTNFARSDFMEIIRIVNGQTIKKEIYPEYAVLEDTFARRTFDESGNYTVEPFDLNMTYRNAIGGITGATLSAEIGEGKAYVFGYEFETQGTSVLSVPRARTTKQHTDQRSIGSVGPSLLVSMGGSANSLTGFDLNSQPIVFFSNGASGATFNNIGSARIRGLFPSGANYSAYLYDISMTGSFTLANATRIFTAANAVIGGGTGQQAFNIVWNGATGTLLNTNDSGLLFDLPKGQRIKSVDGVNYAVTNFIRVAVGANGSIPAINTGSSNKTISFTSPQSNIVTPSVDLFVLSTTGAAVGFTAAVPFSTQLVITANAPNQNVYVFYTTDMAGTLAASPNYIKRTKTLVTETLSGVTFAAQTDPQTGRNLLYIGKGATAYTDVVSVSSITGTLNGTSSRQLLNYFAFDSGQRNDYYDWSRLLFNSNAEPSSSDLSGSGRFGITGSYEMTITRFAHQGADGPFTVDSYSCDYKDIPVYVSPTTGRAYRLSDVLDFRSVKTPNGSLTGHVIPMPLGAANDNKFTYTHYLPRTDKIVLGRDRTFKLVQGIPSLEALPPSDDPDAMTLYNVTLNGFTIDKNDVQINRIENKRYTMQDIAQLEDRLDAVEYFTNLSLLEQQAKNSPILDSNGLEIPKKGILVDGFRGHSVSDVQDSMYSASIDFENGEMRPAFRNRVYRLNRVSSPVNITGSSDGIYTLSYTTSPLINQPLATTSLNINPSGVFNYLGIVRSTPSSDFWYDDITAPTVRINTEGENDAWAFAPASGTGPGQGRGFGTQWNDWESNWSGISRTNNSIPDNLDSSRSIFVNSAGSRLQPPSSINSILPNSIVNNIGDLQVRNDILPYARSIEVRLDAKNLKPNTGLYLFLDGVITTIDSGITSDSSGSVTNLRFSVPFASLSTGRKSIRLTDSPTNDLLTTTTAADCVFPVQGTWGNYKDGIVSTRTVQTRRESVRSEKIVTNIFGKNIQRSGFTKLLGYTDPLSQSFYVDPSLYPSGVYAKKITLFFKSKDSNANTPLSLLLKPVINGYPHPSKFLPLSDVTITSNSITTSTDASVGVDFEFTSPVFLNPGEYAFSLLTPSNNFEIYSSQIGSSVIKKTTNEATVRATKQPHARSLYKNQTSSGVQKTDVEDIKFLVHICEFTQSTPTSVVLANEGSAYYGASLIADAARFNIPVILPPDTTMTISESGLVGGLINPNKTITLPSSTSKNANTQFTNLTMSMETTDKFVSPLFDIDRANVYCIENRINNPAVPFTGETASNNLGVSEANRHISRYITKRVVLEPGMEANNIRVEMLASEPAETDFRVYARMSPENGTGLPFDLRQYVEMTPAMSYPNTAVGEYQEMAYSLTGQPDFRVFAVKIVMKSSDGTIVPVFKNLRITAA